MLTEIASAPDTRDDLGTRTLPFAKFQGAGNDFVIVDGRELEHVSDADWSTLARQTCDRHFGVGADGLLLAAVPDAPGAAYRMRMFNPDGSEAEMCGNGLRCFVRWLVERGEVGAGAYLVETGAGVLRTVVEPDGTVSAGMGRPRFSPEAIPLSEAAVATLAYLVTPTDRAPMTSPAGPATATPATVALAAAGPATAATLGAPGHTVTIDGPILNLPLSIPALPDTEFTATCVSMGNPHVVLFVRDVASFPLELVGPALETHPFFPARANVEVCQVVKPDSIKVRVWERGAGITLACGTGACAAMVAAHLHGLVGHRVHVELPGGILEVEWHGHSDAPLGVTSEGVAAGQNVGQRGLVDSRARPVPLASPPTEVILRGPATHVFDGVWPVSSAL